MLARVPTVESEDGFTLVEILVALVILSVCIIALVSAMTSLLLATEHHRGQGATDTVVRDYGEAIKQKAISATTYTKCPTTADLTPSTFPSDARFKTPTIDKVEYWVSTSPNDPTTGSYTTNRATCTARYDFLCIVGGVTSVRHECDPGIQRVTISVQAAAASLRGGQTTTRILVRRGNAVNP
jgi:prepilin-type N-terminal cleavage/methylation domain-containing protein